MASSMIHVAVCSEINKKLKRNSKQLFIGTIAPDISKLVGEDKLYSHFLDNVEVSVPNLKKFLNRYISYLGDDFVLGYYIHLYTDYLWFKYFIPEIYDESKNLITKMDGSVVNCHGRMAEIYIYNDYTNLNEHLIKKYNLNFEFLNNEKIAMRDIIKEAHMNKLYLIINKTKELYEGSKIDREYVFNSENIDNFISLAVKIITADLEELKIL